MNWLCNERLLITKLASNTQSFGFVSKGNLNRSDKILCFTIRINSQCPVCKSRPHMFNIYARSFYFSSSFRQEWFFSAFWSTKKLEFFNTILGKNFPGSFCWNWKHAAKKGKTANIALVLLNKAGRYFDYIWHLSRTNKSLISVMYLYGDRQLLVNIYFD